MINCAAFFPEACVVGTELRIEYCAQPLPKQSREQLVEQGDDSDRTIVFDEFSVPAFEQDVQTCLPPRIW